MKKRIKMKRVIKNKGLIFTIIALSLLVITSMQISAQNENISTSNYTLAANVLNQSRIDMQEMIEEGFNVFRVNDTLNQITQLFDAQYALELRGGKPDYSLVLEGSKIITNIKEQSENVKDELTVLESRFENLDKEKESYSIFNKAKKEFEDERYEQSVEFIEETYLKIDEEQSLQTKVGVIYESGTATIIKFIKKRWKGLTFTIIFLILFYLIFHKKIAIYLIDRKINELYFEKGVLEKLTKENQYEYFHLFKIPEELYNVRIEKFGELIRDIDRQIPLLLEKKEKIKRSGQDFSDEESKILNKKIKLIFLSLFILVALIVLLIGLLIYLGRITYNGLLEFILNPWFIYVSIALIILILFGILITIYFLKKKGTLKTQKSPELVEEKHSKFLQFLLNKINTLKLYVKEKREKAHQEKRYSELLKEKKKEESRGEEYIKKQKINSLAEKIKNIFYSPFHGLREYLNNFNYSRKQKIKMKEEERILEKLQNKDKINPNFTDENKKEKFS